MSATPEATIRTSVEDFVVDEISAYEPSGEGTHLFVRFRKTRLTTNDALAAIAHALGVDPREAGYAGMKDKHAIATQTASFSFPLARDAEAAVASVSIPGIEILSAARHGNKLKPGHLTGNRFTLVLREIASEHVSTIRARLVAAGKTGVPNAFGPQRFGRDGDNPERALAWLSGQQRGPRDKRDQRMIFSALQSKLFNDLLTMRVDEGSFATVLAGDLAKKHDTGGLFLVPLEGPDFEDAKARAEASVISATGPMFGCKMRWPEGAPLALEREVLSTSGVRDEHLEAFRHLGEGTRRSLRMLVEEMTVEDLAPKTTDGPESPSAELSPGSGLRVSFVLPKGGFATTVLAEACHVIDKTRPTRREEPSEAPAEQA